MNLKVDDPRFLNSEDSLVQMWLEYINSDRVSDSVRKSALSHSWVSLNEKNNPFDNNYLQISCSVCGMVVEKEFDKFFYHDVGGIVFEVRGMIRVIGNSCIGPQIPSCNDRIMSKALS